MNAIVMCDCESSRRYPRWSYISSLFIFFFHVHASYPPTEFSRLHLILFWELFILTDVKSISLRKTCEAYGHYRVDVIRSLRSQECHGRLHIWNVNTAAPTHVAHTVPRTNVARPSSWMWAMNGEKAKAAGEEDAYCCIHDPKHVWNTAYCVNQPEWFESFQI